MLVAKAATTAILLQELLHEGVDSNCDITICDSAVTAQAAFENGWFHLVVTELNLVAVNDGLALALFAKKRSSFTKTVVMSGLDMVTEEEVLGNLGVDAFLRKPFENKVAVALFKKLLRVREFPATMR